MLSVYIVYRMHKVKRRMVKTNAMNTQGDMLPVFIVCYRIAKCIREITRGSNMCHYLTTNDLVYDRMK